MAVEMGAEVTMGEMVFSKTLLGRNFAERARLRQAPNETFFGRPAEHSTGIYVSQTLLERLYFAERPSKLVESWSAYCRSTDGDKDYR
jgi:hypothetical protein